MKILLIEDEKKLAGFIEDGLRQAGHTVLTCHDGSEGLSKAGSEAFDLILLDLMLPGMNGFEILKSLRAFRIEIPVIILSALGTTEHIVEGLDLGAVDYIKKPFDWEELLARVRILQRKQFAAGSSVIQLDELRLDLLSRKVSRAGKDIELTQKEFMLLEYLARNANRVVSRNQLLENAWGIDFDPESNIVEVYLYQLRKKIDKGFEYPMLKTMVGAGYMIKGDKTAT